MARPRYLPVGMSSSQQAPQAQLLASHFTVYNFEVEGLHDYFVGEAGVLGHNCDVGLGEAAGRRGGINLAAGVLERFGEIVFKRDVRECEGDQVGVGFDARALFVRITLLVAALALARTLWDGPVELSVVRG